MPKCNVKPHLLLRTLILVCSSPRLPSNPRLGLLSQGRSMKQLLSEFTPVEQPGDLSPDRLCCFGGTLRLDLSLLRLRTLQPLPTRQVALGDRPHITYRAAVRVRANGRCRAREPLGRLDKAMQAAEAKIRTTRAALKASHGSQPGRVGRRERHGMCHAGRGGRPVTASTRARSHPSVLASR